MRATFYVIATDRNQNYIFGASDTEGEARIIRHNVSEDRGTMWDNFQRQWGDQYALSYAEAVACLRHCQDQGLQNIQLLEVDTTYSFN